MQALILVSRIDGGIRSNPEGMTGHSPHLDRAIPGSWCALQLLLQLVARVVSLCTSVTAPINELLIGETPGNHFTIK
jgi:hypothetical protein